MVADSVAEDEYMETRHKSGAMMRAIDVAEESLNSLSLDGRGLG